MAGRSTESLDLMPNESRGSRVAAVVLFGIAGAVPLGIWAIFLFGVEPEQWRSSLEFGLSAENEVRPYFILVSVAAVFSLVAAILVAFQRRRAVLRAVLLGGVAQVVAYAVAGGWVMSLVAAMPLWWAYKVQHEV